MLSSGAILALGLRTGAGAPAHYVDFTGNLGGVSHYGRLAYGRGHYSRIDAFAPIFAGDFDLVGSATFAGDFRPVVTFAATTLSFVAELAGDLAPSVTFAANLSLVVDLAGDMAPQVALGASLAVDLAFEAALDGAFAFTVFLAASGMISGPLWASSEPCPASPWTPTDSCPPSMWTPIDPCAPVEWEDSELCNG